MDSLKNNNTWVLVKKPPNQKLIDCKWIFKLKEGVTPEDNRKYKARLVAKGYIQRKGVDDLVLLK